MKKKIALSMLLSFVFLTSTACTGSTQNGNKDGETPSANAYAATVNSLVATDALGRSFGEN